MAGASASMAGQPGTGAASSDAGKGGPAGAPAAVAGGAGDSAGVGGVAGDTATAGAGGLAEAGTGNMDGTGGAPPVAHITSSAAAGVVTEEDFKALCDARSGTVELMPHCGGFATAKGFSYDNNTQLLSEHTCAGANTCGGWNCVIAD